MLDNYKLRSDLYLDLDPELGRFSNVKSLVRLKLKIVQSPFAIPTEPFFWKHESLLLCLI